tara:strand:- start:617 stop:826 length:210 start_codon:yes stop_codon:yes gene_type:complete
MNKLLLYISVILFAIFSSAWAEDIINKYEPNELYDESDCQQINENMEAEKSKDNMTVADLACISFFGKN